MNIKRLIVLILVFIILMSSFSYCINDKNLLVIAGEQNYPPFEYVDYDGVYRGFNVDLIKALALEMGIEIRQEPMDWVSAHLSLQNGSIDAIQGMNYNDARRRMYDFSKEYLKNSLICFVRKSESKILGVDSLKGRKVAVQRSDFAAYALADIGEIEVLFFSTLDEAFAILLKEEVDAVVGNKLTGQYIIQKNRVANDIKMVGNDINYTSYGMAFRKGNEEIANEFNIALDNLKKQGTYYKIYEKWFGKEIKPAWRDLTNTIYVISLVLLIIMTVLFIFYRINKILRKQVEDRTVKLSLANLELEQHHNTILERDKYKEQIINGIGNGLITFDNNGIITTINRSCEILLDIKCMDYVGKKYDEVGFERYFNINNIRECIEHKKEFYFKEQKYIRDHKELTITNTIRPLYNLINANIGAVMTFNDITEITLLRTKLAESEKMHSLGEVVSGLAHEIRNPLTSIKTYIDLLPIKYDNENFRDKITTQVPIEIARLNGLLTELMDYSKPRKLIKEKFDIVNLLNQIMDFFSQDFIRKKIKFNYLDKSEKFIYADKQQIKQMLINILLNSIDAVADEGSIIVDIKDIKKIIVLSIFDNGVGIVEEDLKNIFNPFFTTKKNGNGLGLALCYQYAKENDGSISISSKLNEWTKVELIFTIID